MKKIMLTIAIAMFASFGFAQKNDIPANVKTRFQNLYPDVKKVKWENGNGHFEAEFEIAESDYSVLFDVSGNLIETEIEIKVADLPATAKAYISSNYPSQKIKEASKITDAKGTVTFEAELKHTEVFFNAAGSFIKEVTEKK